MAQEDKQLLLQDLSARLPYNVVIHCIDDDVDYKCFLTTDILNEILHNIEYYNYKPYLRPISSMTEKEVIEFNDIVGYEVMNNWIKCTKLFGSCGIKISGCVELIDFLNAHHFDYRGLIEKGLALEAPKDMYQVN